MPKRKDAGARWSYSRRVYRALHKLTGPTYHEVGYGQLTSVYDAKGNFKYEYVSIWLDNDVAPKGKIILDTKARKTSPRDYRSGKQAAV